jgi:hypothetical protein
MAGTEVSNETPWQLAELHAQDEEGAPLLVAVVKGTFEIRADGSCRAAELQLPVFVAGQTWGEDAATSSYKYEPDIAFHKPATDVVVVGHAWARADAAEPMLVGIELGPVKLVAHVVGTRRWERAVVGWRATPPEPFEKIPLRWEESFGGGERPGEADACHYEARNPVGKGFCGPGTDPEGLELPRIEHPDEPLGSPRQRRTPRGFGFVSPHWQPRAGLAGTYDDEWQQTRAPLLPQDFDRRYFNAAPGDLISDTYLRGDERGRLLGMTPAGALTFQLPGIPPPTASVYSRRSGASLISMSLDTVIIEPDDRRVQLVWRGHLALAEGPEEVASILVGTKH